MKTVTVLSLKKSNKSVAILAVFSILFTILLLGVMGSGCSKDSSNRIDFYVVDNDNIKKGEWVCFRNDSYKAGTYIWSTEEVVFSGASVVKLEGVNKDGSSVDGVSDIYITSREDVYINFNIAGDYIVKLTAYGKRNQGEHEEIITVN